MSCFCAILCILAVANYTQLAEFKPPQLFGAKPMIIRRNPRLSISGWVQRSSLACFMGIVSKPQSGSFIQRLATLMDALVKLIHLIAAIVWMGGMTFMLFALRPAALLILEPQPRARLMGAVWQRFFPLVLVAIAALFITGSNLYTTMFRAAKLASGVGSVPLGWNVMLVLGVVMMLIFGHIYFAGFKKYKRAVAAGEWPVAAKAAGLIHKMVIANFVLGWLAIAAVRLVH